MSRNASLNDCTTATHYFAQRLLFREAAAHALEGFRRFDNEYLGFWRAYCLFKSGSRGEAQTALAEIEKKGELADLVQKLKGLITGQTSRCDFTYHGSCSDNLYFNLVLVHLYEGDEKSAKSVLKALPAGVPLFELLRGMVTLRSFKSHRKTESSTKLTSAIDKARGHLTAAHSAMPDHGLTLLAMIELEEKARQTKEMGAMVSKLADTLGVEGIVGLERTNYFIVCNNWEAASGHLEMASSSEPGNILALKFRLLETFVRVSSLSSAFEIYSQVTARIEQDYGSGNPDLLLDVVSFVNRVSGNSEVMLNHSVAVLTKTRNQIGDDYGVLTELGMAYILLGDLDAAEGCYQRASLIENNQVEHVLRLVQIKLFKGDLDEAGANLEFFKEISSTLKCESSEVSFLEALLCFMRGKRLREKSAASQAADAELKCSDELFDDAIRHHISATKSSACNFEFFRQFNPSFLLAVSLFFMKDLDLCLSFAKFGLRQMAVPDKFFAKSIRLLEVLVQRLPGIMEAHLALIKAHVMNGSLDAAQTLIEKLLEANCTTQQAHIFYLFVALMRAQETRSEEEVQRVLSQSTSANFELLQNPEFLYLKSQAELVAKNPTAALKSLQKAKQLIDGADGGEPGDAHRRPNRAKPEGSQPKRAEAASVRKINKTLRAEINCELAVLLCVNGEQEAGRGLIQEAISEFAGTESAIFVVLANSEIALLNKDPKTAIEILKNVDSQDQGFVVSRKRLAEIYLKNLKQKRPFIQSLAEVASRFPTAENRRSLADGYFLVAEFDEAQRIYSDLGAKDPENEELCLRVGECFAKTHNFVKARNYFAGLVNSSPNCLSYRVFMAELLRKTRMFSEIPSYLSFEAVTSKPSFSDSETPNFRKTMGVRVRAAVLLSEHFAWAYKESMDPAKFKRAVACMESAIDTQRMLIETLRGGYKKVDAERRALGELHYSMYTLCATNCNDLNSLLPIVDECIKNDPENLTYHLLHGRIYLATGNLEIAKEKAKQIFKADFRMPGAVVLFADCLLQAGQIDSGLKGFMKIFEKDFSANNCTFVLTSLVWFHRCAGTLQEFLKLLGRHSVQTLDDPQDRAKGRSCPTGGNDPYLNYCYGVYYYSIRNFNMAIEELAKCRKVPELAAPAAVVLVDIYLHSNSFNLYSNFLQKEKFRTVPKPHLEIAKGLIAELTHPDFAVEKAVFTLAVDGLLDAARIPDAIKGLEALLARPATEISHSMILYFLAIFYLKSKEKDRLKEVFQAMKELVFRPKHYFDEYYFRASMLCADTLLFKDKQKAAKAIIDQCVAISKGCLLSYDYLIVHNERQKESCVDVLRTAFQITNNEDPNLGYKLARDLMNEGRSHESFQVCKQVLGRHPKFRQIEADVLLRVKDDLLSNC